MTYGKRDDIGAVEGLPAAIRWLDYSFRGINGVFTASRRPFLSSPGELQLDARVGSIDILPLPSTVVLSDSVHSCLFSLLSRIVGDENEFLWEDTFSGARIGICIVGAVFALGLGHADQIAT